MCEHEQITTTHSHFRLCDGDVRAAPLRSSLQPEEVYSAAAVRLSGAQRVFEIGLPQAGGLLRDAPDLCRAIHLKVVPHFTTFQKAARRLLVAAPVRRLLDDTIHVGVAVHRTKRRVALAALDGTGFESRHVSSYYVRRRESGGNFRGKWHSLSYHHYPMAGILFDCASHIDRGGCPGPRAQAGQPALPPSAERGPATREGVGAGCGRGLRQRGRARIRAL